MEISLNNKIINVEVLTDKVCIRLSDFSKVLSLPEKFIVGAIHTFEEYAYEIKGEEYYDINVFLIFASQYAKSDITSIYNGLKEKGLNKYVKSYISDKIENEKLFNLDFIDIMDNFEDFINTSLKAEKTESDENYGFYFEEFNFNDAEILLYKIKRKYDLDENFGKVVLPDKLQNILNNLNNENDDYNLETSTNKAAYLLYNIVKEKPYHSYNFVIGGLFAMYYLYINDDLMIDGNCLFSSSDVTYMTDICEKYVDDEAIKVISTFLSQKCKWKSPKVQLCLKKLNQNYNNENLINYIISFVEKYYIRYGFYDYFDSFGRAVKLHYSGTFYKFKLNVYETMNTRSLVFDVLGRADIESINVSDSIDFFDTLYNEIQVRATKNLERELKKKIKDNVKHTSSIIDNITFIIYWNINIEDY